MRTILCFFAKLIQKIRLLFRGDRVLPAEFLRPRSPHFSDGTETFTDRTEMDTESVVFLGDSMTYYGNWSKAFPGVNTSNQGIGGDTTDKVLARIAPIVRAHPKAIFLRIGINDLQSDKIRCEYGPTYRSIVATLRLYSPKTKLYCLAVCPIGKPFENYHYDIRERIREYNRFIAEMCKIYGAYFVNDHSLLADIDGWLRPEYYCDGLHLSPEGYKVVFKVIAPLL